LYILIMLSSFLTVSLRPFFPITAPASVSGPHNPKVAPVLNVHLICSRKKRLANISLIRNRRSFKVKSVTLFRYLLVLSFQSFQ